MIMITHGARKERKTVLNHAQKDSNWLRVKLLSVVARVRMQRVLTDFVWV